MFVSKTHNIVFPQTEHVALATEIAKHWGNEDFDQPPVPYESFVKAVSHHDGGYGHYDAREVGHQTEQKIYTLWRRSSVQKLDDPYAEIIIKKHFSRLASTHPDFPLLVRLRGELEEEIKELYKRNEFDPRPFEITDSVMNACDMISFTFCFEKPTASEIEVYANIIDEEKTTLTFSINEKHTIMINPYPLDEAIVTGTLTAYEKEDYPKVLLPTEVDYQIMNK